MGTGSEQICSARLAFSLGILTVMDVNGPHAWRISCWNSGGSFGCQETKMVMDATMPHNYRQPISRLFVCWNSFTSNILRIHHNNYDGFLMTSFYPATMAYEQDTAMAQ
jgi:hypothetical protein